MLYDDVLAALAWLRAHLEIETVGLYGNDAVVLHAALVAGGTASGHGDSRHHEAGRSRPHPHMGHK